MSVEREGGRKERMSRCGVCELYSAATQTHGSCEFWKCMDVRPEWMEGEKVPVHPVQHDDGENCEAFIPLNDHPGARTNWLLDNLTSMN